MVKEATLCINDVVIGLNETKIEFDYEFTDGCFKVTMDGELFVFDDHQFRSDERHYNKNAHDTGCYLNEYGTFVALKFVGNNFNIKSAIDVGAQDGFTSMMIHKYTGASVIGFEINSDITHNYTWKNLELNKDILNNQVHILNVGIGRQNNMQAAGTERGYKQTDIMSTTIALDQLKPCDLLFIDIEGWGNAAIDGGLNHIKNGLPIVFWECHNHLFPGFERHDSIILKQLTDIGYLLFQNRNHRSSFGEWSFTGTNIPDYKDGMFMLVHESKLNIN